VVCALVGLGFASLVGAGIYRGARRINLRTFFRWTGIALVFIAGGLLANAIHELVEVGWINVGTAVVFDWSSVLPHEPMAGAPDGIGLVIGQLLRALIGYNSRPEAVMLLAGVAYIGTVLALYLRPVTVRPRPAEATPVAGTAG
jgi:high-affinity iron transporter